MNASARAVSDAKALFERELATLGRTATWRQRTQTIPGGEGRIARAAGRKDPTEGAWAREELDSDLFQTRGDIMVYLRLPTDRRGDPVALLTGMATARCALEHAVQPGDLLILDGAYWMVDGAAVQLIYRELTLRRL